MTKMLTYDEQKNMTTTFDGAGRDALSFETLLALADACGVADRFDVCVERNFEFASWKTLEEHCRDVRSGGATHYRAVKFRIRWCDSRMDREYALPMEERVVDLVYNVMYASNKHFVRDNDVRLCDLRRLCDRAGAGAYQVRDEHGDWVALTPDVVDMVERGRMKVADFRVVRPEAEFDLEALLREGRTGEIEVMRRYNGQSVMLPLTRDVVDMVTRTGNYKVTGVKLSPLPVLTRDSVSATRLRELMCDANCHYQVKLRSIMDAEWVWMRLTEEVTRGVERNLAVVSDYRSLDIVTAADEQVCPRRTVTLCQARKTGKRYSHTKPIDLHKCEHSPLETFTAEMRGSGCSSDRT